MDDLKNLNLDSYTPSPKTKQLLKDTPILFIVGPTGAGKDTLVRKLAKTGHFRRIVTHTTRSPRHNHGILEIDGQDYHFIDPAMAKDMVEDKSFIEAAIIHGNLYGTSVSEFEAAENEEKIGVADVDVHGVTSYRKLSDKVTAVFLLTPSFEIMMQRLTKRYGHSNNDQDINIRLGTALDELKQLLKVDYYYAVINDDFPQTLKTVEQIVAGKEYSSTANLKARQLAKQLIDSINLYLSKAI